ncbi:MAG: hypothetical protein U0872_07695 [Planctomycetaceae bacterium]
MRTRGDKSQAMGTATSESKKKARRATNRRAFVMMGVRDKLMVAVDDHPGAPVHADGVPMARASEMRPEIAGDNVLRRHGIGSRGKIACSTRERPSDREVIRGLNAW